jgi:hypothetical protein
MPDPLDRLTLAQQKIDELFGADYARAHPEVLVVVVQSAASDWAAARLAAAIEHVGLHDDDDDDDDDVSPSPTHQPTGDNDDARPVRR